MDIKLINIGFGNIVAAGRVIAVVSPDSAPIKRIIQEARDSERLIDASYGRRTRSVVIMDSDHVVLSAVQPETIAHRMAWYQAPRARVREQSVGNCWLRHQSWPIPSLPLPGSQGRGR